MLPMLEDSAGGRVGPRVVLLLFFCLTLSVIYVYVTYVDQTVNGKCVDLSWVHVTMLHNERLNKDPAHKNNGKK